MLFCKLINFSSLIYNYIYYAARYYSTYHDTKWYPNIFHTSSLQEQTVQTWLKPETSMIPWTNSNWENPQSHAAIKCGINKIILIWWWACETNLQLAFLLSFKSYMHCQLHYMDSALLQTSASNIYHVIPSFTCAYTKKSYIIKQQLLSSIQNYANMNLKNSSLCP